jgi:hypothetical protein
MLSEGWYNAFETSADARNAFARSGLDFAKLRPRGMPARMSRVRLG